MRWTTPDDVPAGRASLLHEALAGVELVRLLRSRVYRRVEPPAAPPPPVLLIPGFLAPDVSMTTMVEWLRRTGYPTHVPRAGLNLRCGETAAAGLEERLDVLVERAGARAAVIGHSRGGQLARVLAARRPDAVGLVVTLGSPDEVDRTAIHPALRVASRGLGMLSLAGIPGLFGASCFVGDCCSDFRADLAQPVHPEVEAVAVVGDHDGLADRRRCVGPPGTCVVRVEASHLGTVANAETYAVLAGLLAAHALRERPVRLRAAA